MNAERKINLLRLKEKILTSAKIGKLSRGGICRLALTDEDKQVRDLFMTWMKEAGLSTRVDDFGNIYGRREGTSLEASPILIGSHLDTQPQGGKFDGVLGVLAALEVIETLNDHRLTTHRPIEIVNFTNEEGARFEPPMLGSGGIAQGFSKEFVMSRTDHAGCSYQSELERIGYNGDADHRAKDIYRYLELHIEQGPVLEQENISIGAVVGIQGMTWLEVRLIGEENHAGTTPMHMRKDALVSAAKMMTTINSIAKVNDDMSRVTVGRLNVWPGSTNCIPGEVRFSVDIRHFDDALRVRLVELIRQNMGTIAAADDVSIEITKLWDIESTSFSKDLVDLVLEGADYFNYSAKSIVSGAGHDAKYIHDMAPSAMIFVPCVKGRSHCQEEWASWEDVEKGANVLLYATYKLAQQV